ncbi:MAG: hypothetical protein Q8M17_06300 [Actinomycetota bacterium]|nr:hypothetical protein [Actinomycetota bacterium]
MDSPADTSKDAEQSPTPGGRPPITADGERTDLFDDLAEQVARIKARREEVRVEAKTASRERRWELGWWMFGATKQLGRLAAAAAAQRQGQHRFMVHEMDGDHIWAVCSCGARFPGSMHEDFTLDEFPALEGHFRDESQKPG